MKKFPYKTIIASALIALALKSPIQSQLERKVEASILPGSVQSLQIDNLIQAKEKELLTYSQKPKIITNPKKLEEITAVAKILYGEARGELDKKLYVQTILSSAKNLKEKKKKSYKELTNLKAGGGAYYYSCFNPKNPNYQKIKNPEKDEPKQWEKCINLAEEFVSNKIKINSNVVNTSNYFVSKYNPKKITHWKKIKKTNIPGWAYEQTWKKGTLYFKLDEKGERIPRKPLATVKLKKGLTAYVYDLS